MAPSVYRFGEFELDTASRELRRNGAAIELPIKAFSCVLHLVENRHRAVGRDELMLAVWGHAHLTVSVLSQAVRHARQAFSDNGEDQRIIRTVRGFGYRWVAPVEVSEVMPAETPHATSPALATAALPGRKRRFRVPLALTASLAALIAIVAALAWHRTPSPPTSPDSPEPAQTTAEPIALLLPVEGADGPDNTWIRLGLMDFIANRLRAAGQPMVPTDTVIMLLHGSTAAPGPSDLLALTEATHARTLLEAQAEQHGQTWHLTLHSLGDTHPALAAAGDGEDVLAAARQAADNLAIALGRIPAPSPDELPAPALLVQRISAAMLTQNRDLARRLIDQAPPELRATPEIRHQLGRIHLYDRDIDGAQSIFESLLGEVSAERDPALRARVLNSLAVTHVVRGERQVAESLFEEAARLLEQHDNVSTRDTLGSIWMNLGNVAQERGDLERARDRMARARRMFEGTGDVRNLAELDLNVGVLEARRERYADALRLFESAARLHAAIQDVDGELKAHCYVLQADLLLLDPMAASKPEARIGELLSRTSDPDLRTRARLDLADLFEATGRVRAANTALTELFALPEATDTLDAVGADVMVKRAEHAGEEGKPDLAAHLANDLVERLRSDTDGVVADDRARAWLLLIRSDISLGRLDAAARAASDLAAWSRDMQPYSPRIYAALAAAEVAAATGNADATRVAFDQALALADEVRIPQRLLQVVERYSDWLLHREVSPARNERLLEIAERIAEYADRDFAAAVVQLRAYQTLGPPEASRSALARAQALAGERRIPADLIEPAT